MAIDTRRSREHVADVVATRGIRKVRRDSPLSSVVSTAPSLVATCLRECGTISKDARNNLNCVCSRFTRSAIAFIQILSTATAIHRDISSFLNNYINERGIVLLFFIKMEEVSETIKRGMIESDFVIRSYGN